MILNVSLDGIRVLESPSPSTCEDDVFVGDDSPFEHCVENLLQLLGIERAKEKYRFDDVHEPTALFFRLRMNDLKGETHIFRYDRY